MSDNDFTPAELRWLRQLMADDVAALTFDPLAKGLHPNQVAGNCKACDRVERRDEERRAFLVKNAWLRKMLINGRAMQPHEMRYFAPLRLQR
jgi:hypothetical protein